MSFVQSGQTVTPQGAGASRRDRTFTGQNYQGGNVSYRIASRDLFSLPALTFDNDKNRPIAGTRWQSGAGTATCLGVILDADGNEVFPFYPLTAAKGANASSTNEEIGAGANDGIVVNYFSSVTRASIPAGDYTLLTFALDLTQQGLIATGSIQIRGLEAGGTTTTPVVTIPNNPTPTPLEPEGVQHTLSYSEGVEGWPSFYSYNPDYMIGMNNFFYSYSGGNLYRHNTNELRNNFYGQQFNSTVTSVINELPLVSKIFKTINLQSDEPWSVSLNTDLQNDGFISNEWFELKEGSWYAAAKNTTQSPTVISNFASRAINGIGRADSFSGLPSTRQFQFISNPSFSIGSILSIGDFLYYNNETANTPELAGRVTQININLQQNINNIVIDASINGATVPTVSNPYVMGVKNNTAESYGLLGHFCRFVLENTGPSPTELFAVQAEIMKSYP